MQSTPSTYIYRGYPSRPIPVPPLVDRGYATGPLRGTEYRVGAGTKPEVFHGLQPQTWVKITALGNDSVNGQPVPSIAFSKPSWYEHPWFLGALVGGLTAVVMTEAVHLGVSAYKRRRSQRTSR
jgi:hypothetical protein